MSTARTKRVPGNDSEKHTGNGCGPDSAGEDNRGPVTLMKLTAF
ncbi:hypothetical protein I546_5102 [Mycobacterium kansasii 732]|nr:hypothetical protein I546_5102 [Mycobacterium kansasii 732]